MASANSGAQVYNWASAIGARQFGHDLVTNLEMQSRQNSWLQSSICRSLGSLQMVQTKPAASTIRRASMASACCVASKSAAAASGVVLQTRHTAPHGNDSTIDNIDVVSVLPQHDVSGAGLGGSSSRLRGSVGNLVNVSLPTLGGSSSKLRSGGGNRDDGMLGVSSVMGELGMSSNLSKPRRCIQRAHGDLSAVAHIGSSNNSKSIGVTLTTLQFLTVGGDIDSVIVGIDIDRLSRIIGMTHLDITLTSSLSVTLATPIGGQSNPWNSIGAVALNSMSSTTGSVLQALTMAYSLICGGSISASGISTPGFVARGVVDVGNGILVSLLLAGGGSISTRLCSMSGSIIVIMLPSVDIIAGSTPDVRGRSHVLPIAELCELATQFGESCQLNGSSGALSRRVSILGSSPCSSKRLSVADQQALNAANRLCSRHHRNQGPRHRQRRHGAVLVVVIMPCIWWRKHW